MRQSDPHEKVCPVHGGVGKKDVVSGFEYEKGKFVEIDPQEIRALRAEKDDVINIDAFTPPDEVDPIYLSGKSFYLVPAGPAGQKPFALLHQVMQEKNRHALTRIILSGHNQTVLIRPLEKVMAMTVLYYS